MASNSIPPTATGAQAGKPAAATGGTASSKVPLPAAEWAKLLEEFPSLS
jgi:hypothetical protein